MGLTNFKVADIPDTPPGPQHPISYLAFLFIDDKKFRKFLECNKAVIPTLRVVLSWNSVPTNDPNQTPYYGNRIDVDIQLARKTRIWWKDIVELAKIKDFASLIDPDFEIPLKAPFVEKTEILFKQNAATDVPVQRTFYSTIGAKLNSTVDFSKAISVLEIGRASCWVRV